MTRSSQTWNLSRPAVLTMCSLALACGRPADPLETDPDPIAPRRPVTEPHAMESPQTPTARPEIEDVKDRPRAFYGKNITLSGEIEKVHSDRAFVLEGSDWLFDQEILVLTKSPVMLGKGAPEEDEDVVVSGTVRRFETGELERELGWDVDQDIEREYTDKPVLVAESVRSVEATAQWSEAGDPKTVITGLWGVYMLPHPADLAGRDVEIGAVSVMAKAQKGIWVGYGDRHQTFVEAPATFDMDSLSVDDTVRIKGKFQTMPETDKAMSEFELPEDMRDKVRQQLLYIEAKELEEVDRAPQPAKGA